MHFPLHVHKDMIRLDTISRCCNGLNMVMEFPHTRVTTLGIGVLESFFETVDLVAEIMSTFAGFASAEFLLEKLEGGQDGAEWHS